MGIPPPLVLPFGVPIGTGYAFSSPVVCRSADGFETVTAIMTAATFVFIGLSFTKPRSHRIFHYITAGITMIAAIAYFTMGSDLGQTPIPVEFVRSDPKVSGTPTNQNREIFYVRYVDWYTVARCMDRA